MALSPQILFQAFLWWIPILLLSPIVFPVLSILFLYKKIVIVLSKLLRKQDLIRPVTGLDIAFSTDDFYGQPYGGLSFIWIVDGFLSPTLVIDRFEKWFASRASASSINIGFEKLTNVVPTFWLGYPFWKKAQKEFDIRDHIKIMEINNVQAKDINKLLCDWMQEPFTQGIPLWELRLVPAVKFSTLSTDETDAKILQETHVKMTTILILKTHHMLGDGYSMLSLLHHIIDTPSEGACCSFKSNETNKPQLKGGKEPRIEKMRKAVEDRRFPLQRESNKSSNFVTLKCGAVASWLKVSRGFFCQLSNTILLTFLTPSTLFSLVNDFGIHRDGCLTKKKHSAQLNLATVSISMKRLNEIRKDLYNSRLLHSQDDHADNHESSAGSNGESSRNCGSVGACKVPILVIAVSALAGALRKLLVQKQTMPSSYKYFWDYDCDDIRKENIYENKSISRISRYTHFVAALPLQKEHPGRHRFCNFWTHGILKVKMSEGNSFKRIQQLNNFYHQIQNCKSPEINHFLVKIFSLLPKPLLRIIAGYNMGASIGVTNMAGSAEPIFIGGKRVLHQYAYAGLQWRHASMTLALLSYDGEITATVLANKCVIPDQKSLNNLVRQFLYEIQNAHE